MLRYLEFPARRAARIKFPNSQSKSLYVIPIDFSPSLRLTLPAAGSNLLVRQALLLTLFQSTGLNQQTLPFIALSRTTPLEHYRGQGRVLPRPPGECCIPGGKEDEVIEVGTGEAKCAFSLHKGNPSLSAKILSTFITRGIPRGDKHLQVIFIAHQ
jgi:hypothetical protein